MDYQTLEVYKSTIDEIKRQARQNGFTEFHWSFSGGEPTAYKQLPDLVKHLDELESSYQSIHMTTNLSPGSKWWKNWCANTELLQRRSITASFHDEFAKEQEFGDKCLQLMHELVHVTVNQVMVPEKFFERAFENISPEISAFLDVQSYQRNNPGSVVHQVKNKAMLPFIRVGDFVGGVPLEKNKLHFAHREICILEMEPKKYIVRIFHKQRDRYILVAANTSAAVINPLIIQEPPLTVIPVEFIRKSAISNLERLDDGEGE
jgi:hypothetical protein